MLPERSAQWPPLEWSAQAAQIATDRAWLVGPGILTTADGLANLGWLQRQVAKLARIPVTDGGTRSTGQHVPLPRLIASTSAALLFSEPPTLTVPEAHSDTPDSSAQEAEDRLLAVSDADGWTAKLLQAGYVASGLGGCYLRPTWDDRSGVRLDVVHYDAAVPKFANGRMVELTIALVVERSPDGTELVHLEQHAAGRVEHALYRRRGNVLSEKLDLGANRATAGLAVDKNGILDLRPVIGDELLVDHVPNWLPHVVTLDRNVGSADCAGIYDRLEALDRSATAWDTDVDLGEAMMIVPDQFLQRTAGIGGGASFDRQQRIFSPVQTSALDASTVMEFVQPEVRSAAFAEAKNDIGSEIALTAGYNPESLDWQQSGSGGMTATEVLARDARSRDTTLAKRRHFGPAIASSAYKMALIDHHLFGGPQPFRPSIEWPDVETDDTAQRAAVVVQLEAARAVSTATKVRMMWPQWTDSQVQAEVEAIEREQSVGDPTGGFGL